MAPDLDPSSYDHKDEELYGLGDVRPVEEFYRTAGMLTDFEIKSGIPETMPRILNVILDIVRSTPK